MLLEICVDSLDSALAAQAGGADRIELCSALSEGGLTPSLGLLETVREHLVIPIQVMIRPRGGDFCYSDLEFRAMRRDIELAKAAGADGVVFGLLQPDGRVDIERTRALLEAARPMSITFHRAFDLTSDPFIALETLIGLGVDRLLTSGQAATAYEGLDLIARLVTRADQRIKIMPGGGVEAHVGEIIEASGVSEVHCSARSPVPSRHPGVSLVGPTRLVADQGRIRRLKRLMS